MKARYLLIIGLVLCLYLMALACDFTSLITPDPTPTPEPTALPAATATATWTPTPTATPRLVMMWPALLYAQIGDEYGGQFEYLIWHYVSEDATIQIIFGQSDKEEFYVATFEHDGEGWVLLEIKPLEETATPTPVSGRETRRGW